jgi:hypothetical protein
VIVPQSLALAAGFHAVVHEGEVIVTGRGEEGPLAEVSPLPGNGIRVCVPGVVAAEEGPSSPPSPTSGIQV